MIRSKHKEHQKSRRNKMKRSFFLAVVVSLIATGIAQADFLYATTFNEELISIDPSTGAGTLIGSLDSEMDAFGLSDRGTSIYTFDQTADRIRQLDPATGHTLATIDIGVSGIIGEGSLAFRSDGIGFMTQSAGSVGQLWSFDITLPGSTAITTDYGLTPSMDGADFDGSDVLYGLSQNSYDLYTINQTTGATTYVGPTGFLSGTGLGGLTFTSNGTLYGVLNDALYTINPGTGAASLVGPIGFNDVSGLTAVIPEPATFVILGLGSLCLIRRKRRS
jgi:hypothetical protein